MSGIFSNPDEEVLHEAIPIYRQRNHQLKKKIMAYNGVAWVPLSNRIREALPWLPPEPPEHEGSIFLPFMKMENDEGDGISCDPSERSLMFAIMVHYPCNAPLITPGVIQPYMRTLLTMLADGFHIESMEELFGQGAAAIRTEYGQSLSRLALKTGMELVPDSSGIKSDFILDTWCRMQNGDREYWPELAGDVVEVFPLIEMEDDFNVAWQACILTYIVSLAILDRWGDAEAAYTKHKEALEDPEDQDRMDWMLTSRQIDMDRLAQPALNCL